MNSAVGPNFKEKFDEVRTYRSREQCMRATQKNTAARIVPFAPYPNPHLVPTPTFLFPSQFFFFFFFSLLKTSSNIVYEVFPINTQKPSTSHHIKF